MIQTAEHRQSNEVEVVLQQNTKVLTILLLCTITISVVAIRSEYWGVYLEP